MIWLFGMIAYQPLTSRMPQVEGSFETASFSVLVWLCTVFVHQTRLHHHVGNGATNCILSRHRYHTFRTTSAVVVPISHPSHASCFPRSFPLRLCCLPGFVFFGWMFRLPPPGSHEGGLSSPSSSSQVPLVLLGAVSGFAGSVLDSLMGAILQGSYYDT